MRKLTAILLAAVMAFSLTACGGGKGESTKAETKGETSAAAQTCLLYTSRCV